MYPSSSHHLRTATSSHQEDMSQYSTKIDATKMPSGWRKKAERVATEIEGQEGATVSGAWGVGRFTQRPCVLLGC